MINILSQDGTILLYLFVFALTTFFANRSQIVKNNKVRFIPAFFILSLLVHWVFLAFSNIGTDYESYASMAENAETILQYSSVEASFYFLLSILYKLFHSTDIVLFIIKTLSLLLIYLSFYKVRNKIDLGLAVFAYNGLSFLQSYYLLSLQLSISLSFIAFVLLMNKRKWWSLIVILFAGTIHSSALIMFLVYLYVVFISRNNAEIGAFKLITTLAMLVVLYAFVSYFSQLLFNSVTALEQYSQYGAIGSYSKGGLMILVHCFFIGLFALLVYKSNFSPYISNVIILFLIFSFFFILLSYKIDAVARMFKCFAPVFCLGLPAFYYNYRLTKPISKKTSLIILYKKSPYLLYLLIQIYTSFSFYFSQYQTSEINRYSFYWPFN